MGLSSGVGCFLSGLFQLKSSERWSFASLGRHRERGLHLGDLREVGELECDLLLHVEARMDVEVLLGVVVRLLQVVLGGLQASVEEP